MKQYKFSGGRWLPASYSVDVAAHQGYMGHSLEGFIDQRPIFVTVVFFMFGGYEIFYKLRLGILLFLEC